MSDANSVHYQPKFAFRLTENYLNNPPKADVRNSKLLGCATIFELIQIPNDRPVLHNFLVLHVYHIAASIK